MDNGTLLRQKLESYSVRELVQALKVIKNGPLGFDYSKTSKDELVSKGVQWVCEGNYRDFRKTSDTRGTAWLDMLPTLFELMDSAASGSAPAHAQLPAPAVDTNDPVAGALANLQKALASRQSIDPEQIRELVAEEVEKQIALATSVYRVEVKDRDSQTWSEDEKPRHYAFPALLTALSRGLNVMLVGPAGSSKTHAAKDASIALSREFYVSGAVGSEYKWLGFRDAQGRYQSTDYRQWFETGGVFCADEFDASNPNAVLALNAGLANGYQDFPDGQVQRHKDALLVACCNTWGQGASRQYIGRNQQDAAMSDRWFFIEWNYDEGLESLLYGGRGRSPKMPTERFSMSAAEWVEYVQAARKAVQKLQLRHVVSMRASAMGAALVGSDIPQAWVEQGALWKGLPAADIEKVKVEINA